MKQIEKVIFDDKSELNAEDDNFNNKVLECLDDYYIEEYAKDYLDLFDEDDVESDINDFSDSEINFEYQSRNLGVITETLIEDDLLNRFSKLMQVASISDLEELVFNLEVKNNLR